MATIKYPGKHDVMLGRGGESNYHSGNIAFRHMVQKYKERFRLGSRTEKNKIIDEVVQEWRDQIPGGRFVAKKKRTDTGDVVWYDVGNEMAKKRAAKSLAEWTPQVNFGSSSSSSSGTTTTTTTTTTARPTKRSRGAGPYSGSASTTSDFSSSNNSKRQNLTTDFPLTVNSCTVLNMANAQQQRQLPEQQIRPLSFFQVAPGTSESGSSNSRGNSSSLAAAAAAATTALDCSTSSASEHSNSSIATITTSLDFSLNQSINTVHNINSTNILPIERIRLQIPTAAELATGAFSDEDEKSTHNSSKTTTHRGSNLHGSNTSLLPNKPQMRILDNNYKGTSSNNNKMAPLGMGFSGTKSLLNDLMRGEEMSSATMAPFGKTIFPGTKSMLDDLFKSGEEVRSNAGSVSTGFQAAGVNSSLEDLLRGDEEASSSNAGGCLGTGFQAGGANSLLKDLFRGEEEASSRITSGSLGTGFQAGGANSLLEDLLRGDEEASSRNTGGSLGTSFPFLEDLLRGDEASPNTLPL